MDKNKGPSSTKRKKIPKNHPTFDAIGKVEVNTRWTIREKSQIYEAMRRYGANDFEMLSKSVTTKTVEQVKYFVERGIQKALKRGESKFLPIDQWLHHIEVRLARKPDYSGALTQALANCPDKRFAGIYQFLVQLLTNDVLAPPESPYDCAVLSKLIQDMAKYVMSLNLLDIHELLETTTVPRKDKNADDANKAASVDDFDRLFRDGFLSNGKDSLSLNPLGISPLLARGVFLSKPASSKR